jgi:hypothetical protein
MAECSNSTVSENNPAQSRSIDRSIGFAAAGAIARHWSTGIASSLAQSCAGSVRSQIRRAGRPEADRRCSGRTRPRVLPCDRQDAERRCRPSSQRQPDAEVGGGGPATARLR